MYSNIKWQSSTVQNRNYFCTNLIGWGYKCEGRVPRSHGQLAVEFTGILLHIVPSMNRRICVETHVKGSTFDSPGHSCWQLGCRVGYLEKLYPSWAMWKDGNPECWLGSHPVTINQILESSLVEMPRCLSESLMKFSMLDLTAAFFIIPRLSGLPWVHPVYKWARG